MRAAVSAALALMVVAAACGSAHRPADPGGIPYQWPPPASVTAGPAGQARFCALVVDDYQHLKAAQQGPRLPSSASPRLVQEYLDFIPGVEAAAPPPIASATRTYYEALARILRMLAADGDQFLAIPLPQLNAFRSDAVNQAWSVVSGYSLERCHYDISANVTTPGAMPPPP